MSSYRAVIIGAGSRALWHARAYRLVDNAELVAVCNRDAGRRQRFCDEFPVRAYDDPVEMIRREQPDLVHLVTPPSERVALMTLISELGVPACLVEKPVAYQVSDWRALVELERTSRTRFGVGAQFRYHPALVACRAALATGELGALQLLDGSAGLNICDQGVHILDWGMSLNGDAAPVRVFGQVSGVDQLGSRHPSPSATTADILFENGVRMLWTLGPTAPRVGAAPEAYKHCRIAACAERGRVLFQELGRWEIQGPKGLRGGQIQQPSDWEAGNDAAQAALTRAMLAWGEGGEPVGVNLARALQQWNAVLGLYASALWQRPVNLPFDPPSELWSELVAMLRSKESSK